MARETAHQLGTPVSSLMGWIKLLEEGDDKEGIMRDHLWNIYYFFAGMMVLQLLWAIIAMPETKGRTLEELEKELVTDA